MLLELRGNPSTGYRWRVITNDDSILLPLGEWFVPDTDLDGAPGLEKFSFHVMAPGAASLRLVYSRPWETGTPPFQTFAVTVEAVDQAAPTAPVTVGSADVGKMIALLPGQLLHVALEGDSTGAWKFMKGDPMFVQQLGNWVVTPLGAGVGSKRRPSVVGDGSQSGGAARAACERTRYWRRRPAQSWPPVTSSFRLWPPASLTWRSGSSRPAFLRPCRPSPPRRWWTGRSTNTYPRWRGSDRHVSPLLDATSKMMDGKKLVDVKLPLLARVVEKVALRKISNTVVEDLLVRYDLIEPEKAAAV